MMTHDYDCTFRAVELRGWPGRRSRYRCTVDDRQIVAEAQTR